MFIISGHATAIKIREYFRLGLLICFIIFFNWNNAFPQVSSNQIGIENIRLNHISIYQGLSQSTIECIAQDSSGFLWFGTQDGLNRYDGYGFVVYEPIPDDSSSISNNYISCLYVDKSGTMWVGTNNGLDRYNSATDSFTAFYKTTGSNKKNDSNKQSISSNNISAITGDKSGGLWIGTDNGLNYFDLSKNKFVHYFHIPKNKSSLLSDTVYSIFVDSENRLWVGTAEGLDLFNSRTKTFTHFVHNSKENNSLVGYQVHSIAEDHSGYLWIGTYSGLDRFNLGSNEFTHFRHSPLHTGSIGSDSIRVIYTDKEGTVWIGTQNRGLQYYNPAKGIFIKLGNSVVNSTFVNDKHIRSLLQDREGLMWIGTFTSGIYKYDMKEKSFGLIRIVDKQGNSLEENEISALFKDSLGNLWTGSFFKGVIKINQRTGKCVRYLHTSNPNSLLNNYINAIFVDQKGFVWIGTTSGLDKLNPITNKFYHFKHSRDNVNSLSADYISSITSDKSGNLWLGLFGGGMDKFNPVSDKFTHYKNLPGNPNSISDNDVNYLFFDNEGILWIGTDDRGLDRFDIKTGKFLHYIHKRNNKNSICNNVVLDIYQFPKDTTGTIWIGTAGGGMSMLNTKTGQFKNFSEKNGLANNEVYAILGDKMGNLWISTNNGISIFNVASRTFRNFDQSDGLQSNEFNQGAFFQDKDGKMYFGGKSGINAFYPDSIKLNTYNPNIVFTSFKDYSTPVKLKNSIWETKNIELSYKSNIMSFSFAALSYTDPWKNKFTYMLKGLNDNWINKGNNNEVTFTNLPAGNYTLLVRGTNNDGIRSSHTASINITILPPFWQTLWFKIIIIGLLALVVFLIVNFRSRSIQLRNKRLEALVSDKTKELNSKKEELEKVNYKQAGLLEKLTVSEKELKEHNRNKDKIISVLAHDLRSPFNGLLGYTDLLSNEIDQMDLEEIKISAKNIHSAANNLFKLFNNLLEWSLLQAGRIKYSPSNENLLNIVNEIIHLFKVNAEQKSISIKTNIDRTLSVWADKDMLDIVLRNLISNAIKFTQSGGEINISSGNSADPGKNGNGYVEIKIRDNGIGMEDGAIERLLNPDFRITTKGTANEMGTGLGLGLCRELIGIQGGKIQIKSKIGEGTLITFTLPCSQNSQVNVS